MIDEWLFDIDSFRMKLNDIITQSDRNYYGNFGSRFHNRYLLLSQNLVTMFAHYAWGLSYEGNFGLSPIPPKMLEPSYWEGATYRGIPVIFTHYGDHSKNIMQVVYVNPIEEF